MPRWGNKTRNRAEWEYRADRLRIMGPWYGRAMVMASSAIPLGITTWLLRAFAGKHTTLDISVAISVSVVANIGMGMALLRERKAMRDQRNELNRIRGRLEALERISEPMLGPEPRGRRGRRR